MQNEEQNVIYRRTEEKNVISSITALNQEPVVPDDHRGVTEYSRLKLNARETVRICTGDLDGGYPYYPRVKKLKDGSYFLTFQNTQDFYGTVYYRTSPDLKEWSENQILFAKRVEEDGRVRGYATCDFTVLKDGSILVVAQYNYREGLLTDDPAAGGLVTRRSTDNGRTWSQEKDIYVGVNWEPSLLQLDTGEIHCYLTHMAPYCAVYGFDNRIRSTGSAILRSRDNGETWDPDVKEVPYAGRRVMQTKVGELSDYAGTGKTVPVFNDQMPVAIQLNNGNIALACETKYFDTSLENPAERYEQYDFSVGISEDNWENELGLEEEGPADITRYHIDGLKFNAPYLDQFISGETVIASSSKIFMGDENGHHFRYLGSCGITDPDKGWWEAISVNGTHTLLHVIPYRVQGNNPHPDNSIVIRTFQLNHCIQAKKADITVDGRNEDWKTYTDALFVGSMSQAQAALRAAHDEENLYFLIERLDRTLSEKGSDTALYFTADGGEHQYRLTASAVGSVSLEEKVPENDTYISMKSTGMQVAVTVAGNPAENTEDEGYMVEAAIPKTAIVFDDSSVLSVDVRLDSTDHDGTVISERMFEQAEDLTDCGRIVLE